MNETEWLAEVDPHRLFYHLQNDPRMRKLRLFCVSCVRRLEKILTNAETTRLALAAAERYADSECSLQELATIESDAEEETRKADTYKLRNAWRAVTWMLSAEMDALGKACSVVEGSALATKNSRLEKAFQAKLLRDVFGNPFRPTRFSREWQTVEVVRLAREMYSTRNFQSMRALATCLENAGCSNEVDILQNRIARDHVTLLTISIRANSHAASRSGQLFG